MQQKTQTKFIIYGNQPLKGEVDIRGFKNAATSILAASLLTDKECIIDNLPLIEDVKVLVELIKKLGAEIDWLGERKLKVKAKNLDPDNLDNNLVSKLRSSVLLIGPLLARCGYVKITQPGGCYIGVRSIDTHIDALKKFGINVEEGNNYFIFKHNPYMLRYQNFKMPNEIVLKEFSVTATENILMMAALNPRKTIIKIAATEPHIKDLIKFLTKLGVEIKSEGDHILTIKGKKRLKGAVHYLISDPIETITFAIAISLTKGTGIIKNIIPEHLDLVFEKMKEFNINFEVKKDKLYIKPNAKFLATKIQAMPYPGFPTDLQSIFGVLATQAMGTTLIHDPMYEGRLKYIDELVRMGANAIICDPHRALITGPTPLYGIDVNSFDLRSGAALIIAGLVAVGKTTINNAYQVDRGYEKIEEKLHKLGANIKRI